MRGQKVRVSEFDAGLECADLILELSPREDCFDWAHYVNVVMCLSKRRNAARLRNDSHVGCNYKEKCQ